MRVLVIGGTGHIGTYLVPMLVEAGHNVTVLTRGVREPYRAGPAWQEARRLVCDRFAEEKAGTFAERVRKLKNDAVVDLLCFKLQSAQELAEALCGEVKHFLHCGTIWIYGPTEISPTPEDFPRRPFGEYGIQKAAIEAYLHELARIRGFPATCVHPGHISGPGWMPINPAGNLDPSVFEKLAAGEEVLLPDQGLATLHHVHAGDVAQVFMRALNRKVSFGESFHAVSPAALTLRGYASAVAGWFGRKPNLKFVPWEQWRTTVASRDAETTWDHISRSPCASMEKARRLLGCSPRFTSLETIRRALVWLIENGKVKAPALSRH